MSLDKVILDQQTKVNIALETLATNRQYSEDKSIYGLKRVDWYIEDVEGDWLEQWPESTSVSHISFRWGCYRFVSASLSKNFYQYKVA